MKQTITIDIDVRDGYELKYNPETRTVEEVKKEPIRSKSWEEFCKNNPNSSGEYYIEPVHPLKVVSATLRSIDNWKTLLQTKEDAEGIVSLIQLTRLHDEWVAGWEPDYKGEWFYSISCYNNRIEVTDNRCIHALLSFPTKEMAKEFLGCFKDLIEKAKRFI